MEKEFSEFKDKVYTELVGIKTDVKLLVQANKGITEAISELKDISKNLYFVMSKQEEHNKDIHELFMRTNRCHSHIEIINNLIKETEELKNAMSTRDKWFLGIVSSVVVTFIIMILNHMVGK